METIGFESLQNIFNWSYTSMVQRAKGRVAQRVVLSSSRSPISPTQRLVIAALPYEKTLCKHCAYVRHNPRPHCRSKTTAGNAGSASELSHVRRTCDSFSYAGVNPLEGINSWREKKTRQWTWLDLVKQRIRIQTNEKWTLTARFMSKII